MIKNLCIGGIVGPEQKTKRNLDKNKGIALQDSGKHGQVLQFSGCRLGLGNPKVNMLCLCYLPNFVC